MSRGSPVKDLARTRGYLPMDRAEGYRSFLVGLCHAAPHLLIGLDKGSPLVLGKSGIAAPLERLTGYFEPSGRVAREPMPLSLGDRFGTPSTCILEPIPALPRTPSGAVDRRALFAKGAAAPFQKAARVAPRSKREQTLAAIWRQVLGVDHVGVHDNFFDLGGHSLLLAQVRGELQKAFDMDLSIVEMFRHPTIEALAASMDQEQTARPRREAAEDRGRKQREAQERQRQRTATRKRSNA
jgi:hypothetical protein